MKQRNGKFLVCCPWLPTRCYVSADGTNGRQPSPVYACWEHAQTVPSARIVMHQYGFTVLIGALGRTSRMSRKARRSW